MLTPGMTKAMSGGRKGALRSDSVLRFFRGGRRTAIFSEPVVFFVFVLKPFLMRKDSASSWRKEATALAFFMNMSVDNISGIMRKPLTPRLTAFFAGSTQLSTSCVSTVMLRTYTGFLSDLSGDRRAAANKM